MPPPTMKSLSMDARLTKTGPSVYTLTFHAFGLAPNSANTVPFPEPLPYLPLRVFLTPVANGALGAVVSLDSSQGADDPTACFGGSGGEPLICWGKLGFDQNNLYVFIGNGVEFQVTVEYMDNCTRRSFRRRTVQS